MEAILLLVEVDALGVDGVQHLGQLVLQLPRRVLAVVSRVEDAANNKKLGRGEPQLAGGWGG